ncbi:striatin-3 isoform X2 [Strongylocentrotus purpuratus]|uniref:Striatin N-terminal domain-containing protein n=1 Tax=Strongylocentrotus purpuratus TaxID=7668 RepID=A0A7M7PWA0_STRPU|nr:striatin-3 isoform X2 [Strongylocentrotus purpuratus]
MIRYRMDSESGLSQNHVNQMNSGSSSVNSISSKQQDDHPRPNYTIPGILHFIQHEWARFEMERAQWEVERAELQARIAFLQGERKGQENLKHDLVRRIKMLEFALKQERTKYQKLKSGSDKDELKAPTFDGEEGGQEESALSPNSVNFRQSRQLLRQYLQEIGYTDTILDIRSNRVRSLLGLAPNERTGPGLETNGQIEPIVNGESPAKQGRHIEQGTTKRQHEKPRMHQALPENVLDKVLSTFDFLSDTLDDDGEVEGDGEEGITADDESDIRESRGKTGTIVKKKKVVGNEGMAGMGEDEDDPDTEEALAEFDFLVAEQSEGAGEARTAEGPEWTIGAGKKGVDLSPTGEEWGVDQGMLNKLKEEYKKSRRNKGIDRRPNKAALQAMLANLDDVSPPASNTPGGSSRSRGADIDITDEADVAVAPRQGIMGADEEALETLRLGELAGLTITNEADVLSYDISANKETFRKTWNPKFTLRSHFDGVRALVFHPEEPVLITGSEDNTLKLWNLQKTVPAKKAASLDVEPIYTFRGHVGAVLSLAVSSNGEQCFSGGMDSSIRCWNIPGSNIDPYDLYDPSVMAETYVGHSDAVWGLSYDGTKNSLVSCSSDGTVKLWSPGKKSPLLTTITAETAFGVPTSVDFVRCDTSQITVGFSSADVAVYDLETAKKVITLDSRLPSDSPTSQINSVASHPTLPVTITAHEDRHIRFFDNNSGKMVHSMVAHLDAVTCLAVDPNGLYLLSGSHDSSIRLWNLDSKTCVQEITSHRKKFDESIFDVAFHPSKPYIASGGADALAKVFV